MKPFTPQQKQDREETLVWLALIAILLFAPPFLFPVALLTETPLRDGFWVFVIALAVATVATLLSNALGKGDY